MVCSALSLVIGLEVLKGIGTIFFFQESPSGKVTDSEELISSGTRVGIYPLLRVVRLCPLVRLNPSESESTAQ